MSSHCPQRLSRGYVGLHNLFFAIFTSPKVGLFEEHQILEEPQHQRREHWGGCTMSTDVSVVLSHAAWSEATFSGPDGKLPVGSGSCDSSTVAASTSRSLVLISTDVAIHTVAYP